MRIACVHQGYELYGSDRSFAESVAAIRRAYPDAQIDVVLPRTGPIIALLEGNCSRILFEPLWVLRRRYILRLLTIGLFHLPAAIARSAARFRAYDVVYINTSVIADYIITARFFPNRSLLHIHEMPAGLTLRVLRAMVRWSRAEIIFNSRATQAAFALPDRIVAHVIYNGLRGPAAPEPVTYDGQRPLRLAMLGRIDPKKGQQVLLEAIAMLPAPLRKRAQIRMVGNAFENPQRELALHQLVRKLELEDTVSIEPFSPEPALLYRWADVIVVPSVVGEALGRVAIEAMAFGRPPIVSAIGGLKEIVEDERTGWLVPPKRPDALAITLQRIIENPAAWHGFAAAGHARYNALFSEEVVDAAIASVIAGKLADHGARPARKGFLTSVEVH
jgi:glycosyltransferase involved in cell wall biosynthesis